MHVARVEANAAGEDLEVIALGAVRWLVDDPAGAVGRPGEGRPASAMVVGRLSIKEAVGWGRGGTLSQPPRRVSSRGRGKNVSTGRAMAGGLAPAGRRARR